MGANKEEARIRLENMDMGKIILAIIVTIIMGYIGIIIGAMLNLEGYLGIIFAIATMGAFILHAIENKK